MNYSVLLLPTRQDCQALIDLATKEKDTLEFKKTGLERQHSTATITSQEIESSLVAINAEIQSLQNAYNSMPEGPTKQDIFNRITRAQYKKFLLEQRKENYGLVALLEKEYDIASIDRCIAESDDFIAQVTARMNQLP